MLNYKIISNLIKLYLLNKYILLMFSILLAYLSSISVSDLGSNFWDNDEGKFYYWGEMYGNGALHDKILPSFSSLLALFDEKSSIEEISFGYLIDFTRYILSYKLFIAIISIYFLFLNDPFLIVFCHKIVMALFFIFFFHKYVSKNYGFKILLLLFLSFNYLNLFFLRETLIFLCGLIFVINFSYYKIKSNGISNNNNSNKLFFNLVNYFSLLSIIFLRPQSIFIYIRLKYIFIFLILLLFCGIAYNVGVLNIDYNNFKFDMIPDIKISKLKAYIHNILSSLNNINPVVKYQFYINRDLYREYCLLFASSFYLILFLIQLLLSLFNKNYYIEPRNNLILGLIIMIIIYSIYNSPIDIRIFLSALSPFFIYFNNKILNLKITLSLLIFLISLKKKKNIFI